MTKKTVKSFKADLNYYKNVAKTQHSAEVLKLELFDLIEEVKKESILTAGERKFLRNRVCL